MSVYYSRTRKKWRYDFTKQRARYTGTWLMTKEAAREAEYKRKEEIKNPNQRPITPTDMDCLTLVNKRLDHVKFHNSESHYRDNRYNAKRWIRKWGSLMCSAITRDMIQNHMNTRRQVSPYAANQDLRHLRAVFNFGKKMGYVTCDPTQGIDFFPIEKKAKYIPPSEDVDKVIACAAPETQDYLWIIRDTLARVGEINHLTWDDVDLKKKEVKLYTRKKKGGHLTARTVPMTAKVHEILCQRYSLRDQSKPWVFWHEYRSRTKKEMVAGPYLDRKSLMRTLCKKAGVRYFRFHPLRHSGASLMDNSGVPIIAIQGILGHENRSTTEIYLHGSKNMARQAMDVYENAR